MKKLLIFILFPLSLFAQEDGIARQGWTTIKIDTINHPNFKPLGVYPNATTLEMWNYPEGALPNGFAVIDGQQVWPTIGEYNRKVKELEDRIDDLEAKIDLLIQLIKKG